MCRALNAMVQSVICLIQVFIRVFMTLMLMAENLIKMVLQTVYNFLSFLLQMLSLVPICLVFLVSSKLKCLFCGSGGGICPVNRGSGDCMMTALAIAVLFFIFRATGFLDKIFYNMGYVKVLNRTSNKNEAMTTSTTTTEAELLRAFQFPGADEPSLGDMAHAFADDDSESGTAVMYLDDSNLAQEYEDGAESDATSLAETLTPKQPPSVHSTGSVPKLNPSPADRSRVKNLTTVLYYLV